jgi:hypothetical protein
MTSLFEGKCGPSVDEEPESFQNISDDEFGPFHYLDCKLIWTLVILVLFVEYVPILKSPMNSKSNGDMGPTLMRRHPLFPNTVINTETMHMT